MGSRRPPGGSHLPAKEPRGQRDLSLPYQEWRFEVGAPDHGARLDGFLRERLRWGSRARLQRAIAEGGVRVLPFKDPQQAEIGRLRAGLRLRTGQEVVVRLATPRSAAAPAVVALQVVHEDGRLLAVNKPPGVNVYPTPRHRTGSLVERVHAWQRQRGGGDPPTLCHRLDRETSGLVLFAKDRAARAEVGRQFEERRVEKVYLALVIGELEQDAGQIELPIRRDPASSVEIKMAALGDGEGRPAATSWRVRRRLPGRTLLELRPDTGRQHQLRVHLAAIGHPIVGDKLYLGGDEVFLRSLDGGLGPDDFAALGLERQALHCWRLALDHPGDGARVTLEAPLWPDLAALAR